MNNPYFADEQEKPRILRREAAKLESLRACMLTENREAQKIGFEQLGENLIYSQDEEFLFRVHVSLSGCIESTDDIEGVEGHSAMTYKRLIFIAETDSSFDFSVDAGCIQLHAISECPHAVYLQIENVNDELQPIEMFMKPEKDRTCQDLFNALSKLISMHPLPLDDDDDDDNDSHDGVVWALNHESSEGVSEEERAAMLQRLDELLVVTPNLAIRDDKNYSDGQFDDADDDEIL